METETSVLETDLGGNWLGVSKSKFVNAFTIRAYKRVSGNSLETGNYRPPKGVRGGRKLPPPQPLNQGAGPKKEEHTARQEGLSQLSSPKNKTGHIKCVKCIERVYGCNIRHLGTLAETLKFHKSFRYLVLRDLMRATGTVALS